MTTSQSISWTDVAREATEHLGHILAIGTSSPPAWELPAANYILGIFEREGIPAFMLPAPNSGSESTSPHRPNLVAHIPGSGAEEPILLLSHLDSAPRDSGTWMTPYAPEGRVLTGPGALEGAHLTVAQAMALILLARSGGDIRRTIRFAATSDGTGGKAGGLKYLAGEHLEHISSDTAIGWGGISWVADDRSPCTLFATADKGILRMKLRSEGDGGSIGIRLGKDPTEQLVRGIERVSELKFPARISTASEMLAHSVAESLTDGELRKSVEALTNPTGIDEAVASIVGNSRLDIGLRALLKASVTVEWGIVKLEADSGRGLRPRTAEAELVYCYPQGADVEALAVQVLEALGPDGVYLAEKSITPPSESDISPEFISIARAAMTDIDSRAKLITGLCPWPTGLGALRELGTSVYGWEPFASPGGNLSETLKARGGSREMLEMNELGREVRAIHSFLCRAV